MVTDPPSPPPFAAWKCYAQPAASLRHPDQLAGVSAEWLSAPVPGTVALALRAANQWDIDQPWTADAKDWWYRTTFSAPTASPCYLCFDGLATLAEVWLNGTSILIA